MNIIRSQVRQLDGLDGFIICLSVPVGSADEPNGYTGIAHLAEHIIARYIQSSLEDYGIEVYCSAKTFIFHTEFMIWSTSGKLNLSFLIEHVCAVIESEVSITNALLKAESNLICKEISFRKGRWSEGILPWSFAPSIYKNGYCQHNTFDVNYESVDLLFEKVSKWISWISTLPCGLGIASQERLLNSCTDETLTTSVENINLGMENPGYVDCNWAMHLDIDDVQVHFIEGLRYKRYFNSFNLSRSFSRTETAIPDFTDYVTKLVMVSALNRMGHGYRFQTGLFGPWSAPDDGCVHVYGKEPCSFWNYFPSDHQIFTSSSRRTLRTVTELVNSPLECAPFLSRCALFGWPSLDQIENILKDISFDAVNILAESYRQASIYRHEFVGLE